MFGTLRTLAAVTLLALLAGMGAAQRPRATTQDSNSTDAATTVPTPSPAPSSVIAKYEGGVFGYNKKMEGTLRFDDSGQRLVFYDQKEKEILFVPYNAITGAYGDTHKVQPAAATVASHAPYIGLPASLIKTKVRYLTLQYNDPDSKVSGVASFKLDNKDILDSVLFTLAGKAGLTRRGEVFVRKAS
ncbi:MAG TPA: hypothetical protein VKD91_24290 [Pyrinomonadaceae bacterium]|nr:hypothetical protein [Pyrinomonadaceae bacterium]